MAVQYKRAKDGYKFALTMLGMEQSRIRAKFEENFSMKKNYERAVPTSWVRLNYVEEIKEEK